MLHVRLAHTLQILFLDELCDAREPCPHVLRQGLDLCANGFIQGLDRPSHVFNIPKKILALATSIQNSGSWSIQWQHFFAPDRARRWRARSERQGIGSRWDSQE